MSINSIIDTNRLPVQEPSGGKQVMGKDDFLKLMMIQMRQQDPLNPMDNEQMLAQMAQFTSLEQMSNLNENFSNANTMAQFMDATRLLGKEVELLDPSSPEDAPRAMKSKVKSVNFTTQGPLLTLDNGLVTTVQELTKVGEPAAQ